MTNALARADALHCASVAIPVFATGHARFKFERAIEAMFAALMSRGRLTTRGGFSRRSIGSASAPYATTMRPTTSLPAPRYSSVSKVRRRAMTMPRPWVSKMRFGSGSR